MRIISIALIAVLAASCGQAQERNQVIVEQPKFVPETPEEVETTEAQEPQEEVTPEPAPNPIQSATQQDNLSDLDTMPGEYWRPRGFNFLAKCERASVDERLPPAVWFDEYEDTKHKVFEEASFIMGTGQQPLVGEHTRFWEMWCPSTGWEEPHIILLVGLYFMEDAYYFDARYRQTGNDAYRERADFAFSESERYIFQGIRDSIPWYGEMPIFGDDPRVEICLAGGRPDHQLMPLCDDYEGPVTDPQSPHYNPNHPTIAEWISR